MCQHTGLESFGRFHNIAGHCFYLFFFLSAKLQLTIRWIAKEVAQGALSL